MSRIHFSKTALAVLTLGLCAGSLHATASLVANPSSLTLNCDTVLGATPASIGITLVAAGSVTVTVSAPTGPVVLPSPAVQTVSSTTVATSYTFSTAAGCKGATNGQVVVLTFTPSTGTALTVNATLAVTDSASALAPSPSAVTLVCTKSGSTYTAGAAQHVSVTSPAPGGTPFTVNTTAQTVNGTVETALPSWLTVTGSGTASSTAITLTITPVGGSTGTGCGALALGTTTYALHLLNPPAPDAVIPVTIEVGAAATLSASPASVSLSYTKGSFTYTPATTSVSSTPPVFFTVNPATLPVWLSASPATATTTSAVTLSFAPTAGAETLALGSYTANVHLVVSGDLDYVVPVTLQVKDPAATLSVAEGTTRTVSWILGTALPSLVITPVSSDSPIAYTVTTTAGSLSPQIGATSGIAYSFGSPITVTFLQSIFGAAAPGAALTGSVTITPASGSAVTVNITVNVKATGATISSLSPSALPTASSGTFTVALSGNGFVTSGGSTVQTNVGIVTGGIIVPDSNVTATLLSTSSIILSITSPANADPLLPFSGTGGTVTIGVCNPQGTGCTAPTSTATITIGINPIVQAVSSASSYIQATAPALPSVAPYDILSIFGTNFCLSGGTGCTGGSSILYGTTDPVTLRYLTTLSPDAAGATQRNLTVTFQTHGTSPTVIATAPLLFATNNQINLVVPGAVATYIGDTVDIVVSFGYGTGGTMLKSAPSTVNIAATDPGVFTVGGDGQGDAAALLPSYALITNSTPAGARTGTDSDYISLYVTGLGVPDAVTGTPAWTSPSSVNCMTAASYFAAVNTVDAPSTPLTSDDGLVLQSAVFPANNIQPCLKHNGTDVPTVTIGGINAPVAFAGWVSGSVVGLYQINAQIPVRTSNFVDAAGDAGQNAGSTPLHLPVVVTANSITSQPVGVNIWVAGSLAVNQTGALTSAGGATWGTGSGNIVSGVSATGSGSYTYAVTSGSSALTAIGLSLSSSGVISGTAADGTATVTITATEATTNVTGSVTVTYTIAN